ncbi:MAG TPA: hypothetical protein VK436_00625 [Methanocella sp.]|nr:hypothetical protein [Methanocella sp.]
MDSGKTNMFYVIGTILILLSLSIAVNGNIGAAHVADHARQGLSSVLSSIVVPGAQAQDTLYDTYCYVHNQYFGLRF